MKADRLRNEGCGMGHKHKKDKDADEHKLSHEAYEAQLYELQVQLVKFQRDLIYV